MRRTHLTPPALLVSCLLGALLGGAAAASSNWPVPPSRLVFDTPYGTLQIKSNDYIYESRLHFNNVEIAPQVQGLLNIPYAFSLPKAQIALVSVSTGNSECPVSYHWVVLKQEGYSLSPSFGSCSENIKVSVQGRNFVVQTPSNKKPDKIDVYAYDGKTIRLRTTHP